MHLSVAAHAINHVTGDQGASIGAKSMCMQELKNRPVFLKKNVRFSKKPSVFEKIKRLPFSSLKFEI
jgi:hypothetical protein